MMIGKILPQPERIIMVGAALDEATPGESPPNPIRRRYPSIWMHDKRRHDRTRLISHTFLAPEEREAVLRMLKPHQRM
jgi:hypothetical protein